MTAGRQVHSDRVLDHIGVATSSLDQASSALALLGLYPEGPDERIAAVNTMVRCFRAGDMLIELVSPLDDTNPLHDFLNAHGPGLHHVAFRVEDLDAEIERFDQEGVEFINREPFTGRAGSRVVFLVPDSQTGMLVELVEHPGADEH